MLVKLFKDHFSLFSSMHLHSFETFNGRTFIFYLYLPFRHYLVDLCDARPLCVQFLFILLSRCYYRLLSKYAVALLHSAEQGDLTLYSGDIFEVPLVGEELYLIVIVHVGMM